MIISEIVGGLGNQMFQYAAGWALARHRGDVHKLDISGFEDYALHHGFEISKVFSADVSIASRDEIRSILGWQSGAFVKRVMSRSLLRSMRKSTLVVEPVMDDFDLLQCNEANLYLRGYWQNEKYFNTYGADLRRQFNFMPLLNDDNLQWIDSMQKVNSVGLHVRRGDYLKKKNMNLLGVCSLEYYMAAIERIAVEVSSPVFYIFSDDFEWVRRNIRISYPIFFIENNQGGSSYNDMRLMGICKHNIISNSTFSWWGAWLNANPNKMVIGPKKWFANGAASRNILPVKWVAI